MEETKKIITQKENETHWYAVYTKSRSEKKVRDELNYKGIECFLPIHRQLRQWSDRKKWVEQPLIPGYIFVHIDYKDHLKVLQTPNIVTFVRFERQPAIIQDSQIDKLKRILRESEIQVEVSHEDFKVGEKIRINAGPLFGMEAELVRFKGKKKVAVRLPEVGTSVLIEVAINELEKLPSNEKTID